MNSLADNIIATARRATAADIEAGMGWYPLARSISEEIAPSVEQGAGVIAALSPRMPWGRNIMLARRAFDNGYLAGGALSANVAKANAILMGADPVNVLGGWKVRAFYDNIINADSMAVTVDRHAVDVAHGRIMPDTLKSRLKGKRLYAQYSDAYVVAADTLGINPSQAQAITWVTWRRIKGIRD